MTPSEIAYIEKHFPNEKDQGKAIWYLRSAKAARAAGHVPTKDRIWDQYAHSAVVHGMRELLEPHKIEKYLPMLEEFGLVVEGTTASEKYR
jgi:hypothetical protein